MKDYDHIVIWLDYFNKTLSRQKGRRLAKDKCIFDPSLSELIESAKAAGLEPTATDDQVRFPRRSFVRSGYIVLEKKLILVGQGSKLELWSDERWNAMINAEDDEDELTEELKNLSI
mgnify:CR=1 FL=1